MTCWHPHLKITQETGVGYCPTCGKFFANIELSNAVSRHLRKLRRRKMVIAIWVAGWLAYTFFLAYLIVIAFGA